MESFVSPTSTLTITPLMRSIYVNGARVIDKLLELGVDINSQVEANGNLTGKYDHQHFLVPRSLGVFDHSFSRYVVSSM